MSHSVVVDRRAGGHTEVRSNEELSDERRVIIRIGIRLDGARGHILDVRAPQLRNGRIDVAVNDRNRHPLARVALGVQRLQVVARIVRLIRDPHVAIHRLRRGSRGDGREHSRQGQGARRGQNGEGTQASGPTNRSHHCVCSFRSGAQALGQAEARH